MRSKLMSLFVLITLLASLLPAVVVAAPSLQSGGKAYTVQKDDWLSKIADKEYGDPYAWEAIYYYNNLKAKEDSTYTFIENPDLIEIGWTLYIPTAEEAAAYMGGEAEVSGQLQLAGSTTVQPLAEELGEAFMAKYPDVIIEVQGGGSSVGVTSAAEGTVDIGNASRAVKSSEFEKFPALQVFTIAYDGIAVVTHPDVQLTSLSVEQIRGIFAGEITNFGEVGGPDAPIVVVSREEGSGTRAAFEEMVMGEETVITDKALLQQSNGQVRTTVSTTPNSIAYLSFGFLDDTTRPVAVDGVEPTVSNVKNGSYPIVRPLNMLTNGVPGSLAEAFLSYILSPLGQTIVAKDYVTID
ncbi:MAG: phosphate ABC transporter substrate-binding protein PstS family protein [Chloroflexota bacterium]